MAVSKSSIPGITYRKQQVLTKVQSNLRQPSTAEKNTVNGIVDDLMGYILAKHSS